MKKLTFGEIPTRGVWYSENCKKPFIGRFCVEVYECHRLLRELSAELGNLGKCWRCAAYCFIASLGKFEWFRRFERVLLLRHEVDKDQVLKVFWLCRTYPYPCRCVLWFIVSSNSTILPWMHLKWHSNLFGRKSINALQFPQTSNRRTLKINVNATRKHRWSQRKNFVDSLDEIHKANLSFWNLH